MLYILLAVLAVLAALIAIVLIRTITFKPKNNVITDESAVEFDKDMAIEALRTLVRFKTVSNSDPSLENDSEFEKLIDSLPALYPSVFKVCTLDRLPDRGLLFKWAGRDSSSASVMMAHYDVVPVNEEGWDKPAFDAILEDGVIWGRGTLDTKVTFNGILSAAEKLISDGFIPDADVYFAFSGGEEVNGRGAVNIVDYFEENNINVTLVVDEGGAVVENVFPGVTAPCGMIGIAEKGMMNLEYRIRSQGGHASAPKPNSPLVALSRACTRMEDHPFKSHLTAPVAEMFDTLGRHSSFVYRMIFANLWLFSGILDMICKKSGGELNALMRTTVAFTQASASKAPNVIPPDAKIISNIRLNPADSIDGAVEYIKKTIKDDSIELVPFDAMEPSRISVTDCPEWNKVASAVASTWRGCIVSPYLMVQCSDSRYYGRISDKVYRFSAMDLTSEERATIHGNNERIRVDCALRAVEFYIRLLSLC